MKYKLVIFDIDGTITRHVSSWQHIHEALGMWDLEAAEYQRLFRAGSISYRRFCELDARHWRGMKVARLRKLFASMPYHKNVPLGVARLKARGLVLAALSTGLQFLADRVRHELGFDYVISNRLRSRDGVLTGGVTINISHGGKGPAASACMKRYGFSRSATIAVGDTDGDVPLCAKAGHSIAFNSSGKALSGMVDYSCHSTDFLELVTHIEKVISLRR